MTEQNHLCRVWDIIEKVGVCMLTTQFAGGLRARGTASEGTWLWGAARGRRPALAGGWAGLRRATSERARWHVLYTLALPGSGRQSAARRQGAENANKHRNVLE
jgi:hypothetical protein